MRLPPRRLLVIDDDADFRAFMVTLLEEEGQRVTTAASLAQASAHLARQGADLVISDLRIWAQQPAAVPAAIAADPLLRGLPILLCSADAQLIAAVVSGLPENMALLAKPFDIDELIEQLARLLERRGPPDRTSWCVD